MPKGRDEETQPAASPSSSSTLLRHAFTALGLHRVIATCDADNEASTRVIEKVGMRREGHFRACHLRGDGTWSDEYFYAMLADEWPAVDG